MKIGIYNLILLITGSVLILNAMNLDKSAFLGAGLIIAAISSVYDKLHKNNV